MCACVRGCICMKQSSSEYIFAHESAREMERGYRGAGRDVGRVGWGGVGGVR